MYEFLIFFNICMIIILMIENYVYKRKLEYHDKFLKRLYDDTNNGFEYLINKIVILSDKVAGYKTKCKLLEKEVKQLEYANDQIKSDNRRLGERVIELNHDLNKLENEIVTHKSTLPNIDIGEARDNE